MLEDLINEIEAINSIYSPETLRKDSSEDHCILAVPGCGVSLRFWFPASYPQDRPQTAGIQSTGSENHKGYATQVHDIADRILRKVFTPGSVCLFDLIQELEQELACESEEHDSRDSSASGKNSDEEQQQKPQVSQPAPPAHDPPRWYRSQAVTEKKSTFLAHTTNVHTPAAARDAIAHLLSADKRVAKATHNITAYRIRDASNPAVTYQDCNDDGETAAGRRLLHLLQLLGVWNVLVVVSRWFGGVKLGPDRFKLINQVAREAVTESNWVKGEDDAS